MKKSFILSLILLLLVPAALSAQKQKTERARAAFESGNYF